MQLIELIKYFREEIKRSGVASGDRTHVCRNHNPMR